MQLFLRVFADCPTPEAAATLQKQLLQALAAWQPVVHAPPLRYWKITAYFEFTFILLPASPGALREVHALAPSGWHDTASDDDISCVWNRGSGSLFLVPAVAWAELALSP
jgi:hypothetical protein